MKPKIESLKLIHQADDSPDTSTIGEYTDQCSDWAIERSSGQYVKFLPEDFEMPSAGREYRFFEPYAGGEERGTKYYQTYGLQDFKRMEELQRGEWYYMGIYWIAEVSHEIKGNPGSRRIQSFRSAGLWGIESDSDESYFKEVAEEQLADLKEHLEHFGVNTRNLKKLAKGITPTDK